MPFDNDTLIDLAGWPTMKAARTLRAAGSVLRASVSQEDDGRVVVKGVVQEGRKKFACTLVIRSAGDADSHCACPASRRDGQICAHAVAVALEGIENAASAPADEMEKEKTPAVQSGPNRDSNGEQWAEIPIRIPLTVSDASEKTKPGVARLTRPTLPGHEFLANRRKETPLALRVVDERLIIPTNLSDTPSEFRKTLAELLRDAESEKTINVSHKWLQLNVDHLHCMFHVECSDRLIESLRLLPGKPAVALEVEGSLKRVDLRLTFDYPEGTAANPPLEKAACSRFAGAIFEPPRSGEGTKQRIYTGFIRGEPTVLDFYAGALDRILGAGEWEVEIGERFAHVTREIEKVRPRFDSRSSGEDWLSFDLQFTTADEIEALPEHEIRRLLETGQNSAKLASGKRAAIDRKALGGLFSSLEELHSDQDGGRDGGRKVTGSQQFYAESIINDFTQNYDFRKVEGIFPTPTGLEADLRPYQRDGLKWLNRRMTAGYGAILADEMGLGKTVQTLALIASLEATRPVLIVAPTSLLATWQREAARFFPGAKALVLHGSARKKRFPEIHAFDLVITSYGSLVRDVEDYPDTEFALAVADEASYLRNPRTKTAKAAAKIRADARMALTGTPIENSIGDLWAIFDFAVPDYLGRRDDFLARFGNELSADTSQLRRRIDPFVLRRTKLEVASELPSKTEQIIYCELTPKQRKTYEIALQQSRENLHKSLEANNSLEMLTVLLRLRQICCDLRLLPGSDEGNSTFSDSDSAKLEALDTLLERALEGGHRVLIFSQFVSMLTLVRKRLDTIGHRYAYIDGSTSAAERAEQVEQFQAPESQIPVFLISLKAGGYGLTLTAADTVVHLDPWWNPAVEAQATDRAHRIGQSRPVTAYKFITTGTVEEKILKLQGRKRQIIGAALDEEQPMMKGLNREDLAEILG